MIFTQLLLETAGLSGFPIDATGTAAPHDGATAVLDIFGPLVHRNGGLMGWIQGEGAAYEDIRAFLSDALADDSVDQVVLNIDSPGGEVAGVFDLADLIYNSRGIKPITAIANESALSAAYLIASAADKVYLSRTASVGSIGVMALHVDQSGAEEKAGLKFTPIYAGERKNDFSPHGPLGEAAFKLAQEKINTTYDLFVQTVARNRGLSESAIRQTEAGIYTGAEAVKLGLADEIQSFNKLVSRGESMSLKTDIRTLLAGKQPDEIAEAMAGVGFVPTDANAQQTDQAKEILSIAELAGVTDLSFVMGMINSGTTPEQARQKILEAKADAAQKSIFSTVSATGIGDVNPLLQDANRRAGKEGK
ncbi:S49 family peptidase [Desulfosarcina ovata]|uniref:Serine peptidase n=1 Tax=Desulfosarcina ovata subsp. ovata TaxID=2752305 RepID=A0A5K8AHM6_9BACT|nr:S49 family peptidase [Desulfosarcina ovata]BBO92058.1 serine peptidase [Desulfosarcina ovata subsp. ovata]